MIRPRQYAIYLFLTLLPHISEMEIWVWGASFFIMAWALFSDYSPKYKPSSYIMTLFTLLIPAAVYLQFGQIWGPEPATSLLLLMISMKLFEVYSHRDSMIIILLILLMAMYHLVFKQDLYSTVYMLIVMTTAFYLLYKLHRPSTGSIKSPNVKLSSFLGYETLLSLPILLALFFFFPRFSSPFGQSQNTDQSVIGFSGELRPGDMANLAQSDEVAFRVYFQSPQKPKPEDLYFRGLTLESTDGINWSRQIQKKEILPSPYISKENQPSNQNTYTIVFEPRFGKTIFSLEYTNSFQILGASGLLYNDGSIESRFTPTNKYQLKGHRQTQSASAGSDSSHLQLPDDFDLKNPLLTKTLEDQKTKNISTKIQFINEYFKKSNFTYSLSTPRYDNLDKLLFDQKLGFCEHFASAAALMGRALQIPSRVVIGFQGGDWNKYGNYLIVKDKQAHAWTEFFIADQGWVRFDPTSMISGYRISLGTTLSDLQLQNQKSFVFANLIENFTSYIESLNNQFTLAMLNMNRDSQLNWLKKLGFQSPNKKTLWFVFSGIFAVTLFVVVLLLYLRKEKLSQTQVLRYKLRQKLKSLNIGYSENLGPLEILELLKTQRPNEKKLYQIVTDYKNLTYTNDSSKTAKELIKELGPS